MGKRTAYVGFKADDAERAAVEAKAARRHNGNISEYLRELVQRDGSAPASTPPTPEASTTTTPSSPSSAPTSAAANTDVQPRQLAVHHVDDIGPDTLRARDNEALAR